MVCCEVHIQLVKCLSLQLQIYSILEYDVQQYTVCGFSSLSLNLFRKSWHLYVIDKNSSAKHT